MPGWRYLVDDEVQLMPPGTVVTVFGPPFGPESQGQYEEQRDFADWAGSIYYNKNPWKPFLFGVGSDRLYESGYRHRANFEVKRDGAGVVITKDNPIAIGDILLPTAATGDYSGTMVEFPELVACKETSGTASNRVLRRVPRNVEIDNPLIERYAEFDCIIVELYVSDTGYIDPNHPIQPPADLYPLDEAEFYGETIQPSGGNNAGSQGYSLVSQGPSSQNVFKNPSFNDLEAQKGDNKLRKRDMGTPNSRSSSFTGSTYASDNSFDLDSDVVDVDDPRWRALSGTSGGGDIVDASDPRWQDLLDESDSGDVVDENDPRWQDLIGGVAGYSDSPGDVVDENDPRWKELSQNFVAGDVVSTDDARWRDLVRGLDLDTNPTASSPSDTTLDDELNWLEIQETLGLNGKQADTDVVSSYDFLGDEDTADTGYGPTDANGGDWQAAGLSDDISDSDFDDYIAQYLQSDEAADFDQNALQQVAAGYGGSTQAADELARLEQEAANYQAQYAY
ncbi:hypothetical protein ABW19_dt0203602 [Dactylella cylindrospora]|nr:hypothetical protein ABW19_dt0203602 [Dactylella cylindrospora]